MKMAMAIVWAAAVVVCGAGAGGCIIDDEPPAPPKPICADECQGLEGVELRQCRCAFCGYCAS